MAKRTTSLLLTSRFLSTSFNSAQVRALALPVCKCSQALKSSADTINLLKTYKGLSASTAFAWPRAEESSQRLAEQGCF